MKKLYTTLALACAVAFGASAVAPKAMVENMPQPSMPVNELFATQKPVMGTPAKAPAAKVAIADINDVCGLYTWEAYDTRNTKDVSTLGSITSVMGPLVSISGYVGAIEGEIDSEAGTLSFEGGQLVYTNREENRSYYLVLAQPAAEAGKYAPYEGPAVATWDGSKFVFPEELVLIAQSEDGYALINFFWGANVLTPYADKTEWKTIGTVEMTDGWILPGFGIEAADYPYEAILQVDPNNSSRYSILDPYKNNPLSIPFEEEGEMVCINVDENASGRIVLDASNPDCVFVEQGFYCGFEDERNGRFYLSNVEGFNATQGATAEQLIPFMEAQGMTPSTFKNNVAELHNLVFGVTGEELAGYSWVGEDGNPTPMNSTITFKIENGVEDTFIGNENAPVEYFNLQGVRVANPENGLYIRRQGNTATKVIVK